jgi:HTH-type transcriptional regulator/antitoxin HigA
MAARAIDLSAYAHLLSKVHPTVPHTEEDNERLIAIVEELDREGRVLSPEQKELLDLLLVLIQDFERARYAPKHPARPHSMVRELMRANNLKPKDMYEIFGSKGTTSEVLRGKRGISKAAAKALAARFNVSTDLFL